MGCSFLGETRKSSSKDNDSINFTLINRYLLQHFDNSLTTRYRVCLHLATFKFLVIAIKPAKTDFNSFNSFLFVLQASHGSC